jgi:hypothetical protein
MKARSKAKAKQYHIMMINGPMIIIFRYRTGQGAKALEQDKEQ